MPSFYPENNTALQFDPPERSLIKIVSLGGGGGGSVTGNTFFGVGSPEGVVTSPTGGIYTTAAGALWAKTSGSGNTGWTQFLS